MRDWFPGAPRSTLFGVRHLFQEHRREKSQVDQWDASGKKIKRLAGTNDLDAFQRKMLELMSVRP
jgi:hypothetical protein